MEFELENLEGMRSRSGSLEGFTSNKADEIPKFSSRTEKNLKSEYFAVIDELSRWPKFQGILVKKIGKTYNKYPFGIKSKQDVEAVKNVYLRIESGELISILGENGAGKTSLIKVITGHLKQTEGNVKIFGLDLNEDSEEVKELVSLCPQFDIYWENLTVYEHLELFSLIKGMRFIESTVDKLIQEVGLSEKRDRRVKELSGGMRRRLSIALSTLGNPKVIIFDEPTTGLDPVTQRDVMKLIEVNFQNFLKFF